MSKYEYRFFKVDRDLLDISHIDERFEFVKLTEFNGDTYAVFRVKEYEESE